MQKQNNWQLSSGDISEAEEIQQLYDRLKFDIVCRGEHFFISDDGAVKANPKDFSYFDLTLSEQALDDLAGAYKVPTLYLRRCFKHDRKLFANNVNTWRSREVTEKELKRRYMFRCYAQNSYFPEQGLQAGKVRAIRSAHYFAIDNGPLIQFVKSYIETAGGSVELGRVAMDEHGLYITLLYPNIKLTSKYDLSREITPGITISNSETGLGFASIAPALYFRELSCGLSFPKWGYNRKHKTHPAPVGIYTPEEVPSGRQEVLTSFRKVFRDKYRTWSAGGVYTLLISKLTQQMGQMEEGGPDLLAKTLNLTEVEKVAFKKILGDGGSGLQILRSIVSSASTAPPSRASEIIENLTKPIKS